ncbi:MAG: DEAD/DEAH box helicase [Pyrobaculum sp.]
MSKALTGLGYSCEKEVKIADSGFADLRCSRGDEVLIVEVKSYPLSSATLADLLQLAMYCAVEGTDCMLAYRGLFRGDSHTVYIRFKRDVADEIIRAIESSAGERQGLKKPGLECFWCEYKESCEFSATRLVMRSQAAQVSAQSASASNCSSLVALYQELIKAEWCLMRHGAVCTNAVRVGGAVLRLYAYLSPSGLTLHNVDAALTQLHIEAAYARASRAVPSSNLLQQLISCGLLVEKKCSSYPTARFKDEEAEFELTGGREAVRHFLTIIDLARAGEDVAMYDPRRAMELFAQSVTGGGRCFKTLHGEFVRLLRSVGPLPGWPVTLEAYLLPFIEDMVGAKNIDANSLINSINALLNKADLVENVIHALRNEANQSISKFSQFQLEGLKRLYELEMRARSAGKPLFYLLTAPPGAGKTVVFMTYAILRALAERDKGKVVILYPTKTLAKQQLQLLVYTVERLNSRNLQLKLAIYDGDSGRKRHDEKVRGLKCSKGELKYDSNGIDILCDGANISWLSEVDVDHADIIVTNPYKLSSDLLSGKSWVKNIGLIIIDEAHQFLEANKLDFLTATLHRLYLSMRHGSEEAPSRLLPDIVVSSATITSSGFPFGSADGMTFRSVGGFIRASSRSGQSRGADLIAELFLGKMLASEYEKGEVDYYTVVTASAGAENVKLTYPVVLFPIPGQSPLDTAAESLVSSIILARATSSTGSLKVRTVLFIDNLDNQKELFKKTIERLLVTEVSMADKLACRPLVLPVAQSVAKQLNLGISTLGQTVLQSALNSQNAVLDSYLHLTLYCRDAASLQNAVGYAKTAYSSQTQLSISAAPLCYQQAVFDAEQVLNSIPSFKKAGYSPQGLPYVPLLRHNAELPLKKRTEVESFIESGEWDAIAATSALEAGVNLPSLGAVFQFGLPEVPEALVQRWGRGGRDASTFFTSLGVLIARNSGEDVMLTDEDYAIKRLFGYEPKALKQVRSDERVKRVLLLVGYQFCRNLDQTCNDMLRQSEVWLTDRRSASISDDVRDTIWSIADICISSHTSSTLLPLSKALDMLATDLTTLASQISDLVQLVQQVGAHQLVQQLLQHLDYISLITQNRGVLYSHLSRLYNVLKTIQNTLDSLDPNMLMPSSYIQLQNKVVRLSNRIIESVLKIISSFYTPPSGRSKPEVCVKRLLATVVVPYMPDPYVAVPQMEYYLVSPRGKIKHNKSKDIEELYDTEAPLWLREYE